MVAVCKRKAKACDNKRSLEYLKHSICVQLNF